MALPDPVVLNKLGVFGMFPMNREITISLRLGRCRSSGETFLAWSAILPR